MEYKVCTCGTIPELVEKVNLHIKDGWIPQGGFELVFSTVAGKGVACQAMIKTTEQPNN